MRFWDASAIAPLLVRERFSGVVAELVRSDPEIVAWWGSRLECASAIRRRERDRSLDAAGAQRSLALLSDLAEAWAEVQPSEAVRASAERALAVHPLRAADALQLAAAMAWAGAAPSRAEVVCLDERLRDAAAREGFSLVP